MNLEEIKENYPHLLLANGYDAAILGVCMRANLEAVCYDCKKVLEILMNDMSEIEALEFFEFNIIGAYVGEHTPVFLY